MGSAVPLPLPVYSQSQVTRAISPVIKLKNESVNRVSIFLGIEGSFQHGQYGHRVKASRDQLENKEARRGGMTSLKTGREKDVNIEFFIKLKYSSRMKAK